MSDALFTPLLLLNFPAFPTSCRTRVSISDIYLTCSIKSADFMESIWTLVILSEWNGMGYKCDRDFKSYSELVIIIVIKIF